MCAYDFITEYPDAQDTAVALANGELAHLEGPLNSNVIVPALQKAPGKP
jgi:hypothetical protein